MKNLQTLLQINDYPLRNKERLLWAAKILVTVLCIGFIIHKLTGYSYPPGSLLISMNNYQWVTLSALLMPLNWYLEVQKWRMSIEEEQLSFKEGVQAVLSGLALNWILPFTLGDVTGRLANAQNRKKVGMALIITRTISMIITLAFGGCGVVYYLGYSSKYYLLIVALSITSLFILSRVYRFAELKSYGRVICLSVIRYLVFSIQFIILIWALVPGLAWETIVLGVGWVFLFRSVVPSLFGNFGIREASALMFFEKYLEVPAVILIPSLLIWIINTVIPSVIGAFLLFKLRLNIAK
ncbi:MAG: hypothetical protein CMP48_12395 [Rickettsiales bacterium]|nr:hypothetical protein [Rickettsiales bacterium]